jgi:A-factor type gamma-butyrolactone 1'-reductase (1S-forming)
MTGLLAGKAVLITGASSGIGASAARLFADEGARLLLTARRADALEQVAATIRRLGTDVVTMAADTTDEAQLRAAVDAAVGRWGRLDGALNNAGRSQGGGRLAEVEPGTFDAVVDVNLRGVYLAMRVEITAMLAGDPPGGSIVNVASIGGTVGAAGQSVYGATKAAVIAMSRAAAVEYGRDGIRVNAIAPGATRTEMMDNWERREPGVIDRLGGLAALGRVGEPEEIAEAAAWLLGDRAGYVTGITLGVDGGAAPWPH